MRIHPTRLTLSAAGVVLAGVGMATTAHAGEEDPTIIDESPIYVEETQTLEPVEQCEIEYTIEDCAAFVDDEDRKLWQPGAVELVDPESLSVGDGDGSGSGGDDTDGSEGGATEDPEDGGSGEPEGGESGDPSGGGSEDGATEGGTTEGGEAEVPAAEPGETEDEAGSGDDGVEGEPSGDSDPANTVDEPTPDSDGATITPSVKSASSSVDGSGTADLLIGVLVAALAVFGLVMVGLGLARRTHPVRNAGR